MKTGVLRPPRGGWRDYVTLLHLPYTAWHLSYVVVGGCLAAEVSWTGSGLTVLAFFLAMGIGAHALDELAGTAAADGDPVAVLVALAVVSVARRLRDRGRGRADFSLWILPLIAVGAFLVLPTTSSCFGGRFHSDVWFALAWGALPVLTGYVACAGTSAAGASSRPRGRPSSRSRSGGSRRPYGTCDVTSSRSPGSSS